MFVVDFFQQIVKNVSVPEPLLEKRFHSVHGYRSFLR